MTAELNDIAARFILRREGDDWSSADEAELKAWLHESARHQAVYWRLESAWNFSRPHRLLKTDESIIRLGNKLRRNMRRLGIAIAASLVPIAASWWLIGALPDNRLTETYQTGVGARKVISLPDGTSIDMNTDSQIDIRYDRSNRLVVVDRGEVYFDVAHDRNRPFVVEAGDRKILDIGTKFLVRLYGEVVSTAVEKGQVRLSRSGANPSSQLNLMAGDRAIANGLATITFSNDMAYIESALSWREGMLRFHDSTLAEVCAQFNRYNATKIHIADRATANVRIGGAFAAGNLDGFLQVLSDAYDIKVERNLQEIRISLR